MASIGSFGTVHEPAEDDFDWFGSKIRVHPDVSDTLEVDFMEKAIALDQQARAFAKEFPDREKMTSADRQREGELIAAAATLTKELVREVIHPDDFDLYWRLGRENRQEQQDHQAVVKGIIAAVGKGRGQSSGDSSSTPSATGGESEVDYLRRVTRGRPDLEAGLVTEINERRQRRAG